MIVTVFSCLVILLILSVPIAVALGSATILPTLIDPEFLMSEAYVIRSIISGVDSTPLLAIPLFVFSGAIMAKGGISNRLFNVSAYFFGKRTGGMPTAVILTCLFYGAISGSGPATCAAVGAMAIPFLISLGYDTLFSTALVASASGLGVIIPPSIPFILWGLGTGASIGNMFIAGIIPGIVIAICLIVYSYFYCKIHGEDRDKIERNYNGLREKGLLNVLKEGIWALMTPVIILGGIYSGAVTPTEAACISVIYSLIVSIIVYKSIKINEIWSEILRLIPSYAPILALIALASAFSRVLTLMGAPKLLTDFLINNFTSKYTFLMALNIVLLFLGMIIDVGPSIVIIGPLLVPIATALDINIIHLGIVIIVNLSIGFVSPPFGLNIFVAAPLGDVSVGDLGKKCIPFVICLIIALLIITYVPELSLSLLSNV
jgi:C4-dicarboxylate transporter DctM subunit